MTAPITHLPQRTQRGWRIIDGDLTYDVEGGHLDRGSIRAVVTARHADVLVYVGKVNLSSPQSRASFLKAIAEKQYVPDERALMALDQAHRSQPVSTRAGEGDGGRDKSGTIAPPCSLDEMIAAFRRRLLLKDVDLLRVLPGAVVAHLLGFDPVWLLLVAPPGGTKSEVLRSLYGYKGVYPLSSLTPKTFASGLDVPGQEPSLLSRLKEEVLVLKDLTTVLEGSRDERQEILAQLREIYDGQFDKAWGTGRELHWEGRLGLVAGVTPIIDRHQQALSVLGERFVLYRMEMPDRREMARTALRGSGQEAAMREELSRSMHGFLGSRVLVKPGVEDRIIDTLASVADFVTRARSGVVRDGARRELDYAPEPEAPTRFAKVLLALGSGIAVCQDHPHLQPSDLALVLRVALDCLPAIRRKVIGALVNEAISDENGMLATSTIAGAAAYSTTTIRRSLEDLQALGIVECRKGGKADEWRLLDQWVDVFRTLTVPEMSDPPSPPLDVAPPADQEREEILI